VIFLFNPLYIKVNALESSILPINGTEAQQHCLINSNSMVGDKSEARGVEPVTQESDQLVTGEHLLNVISFKSEQPSDIQSVQRIIIDSGASSHMMPSECYLQGVDTTINGLVSLGDNKRKLSIVGAGYTSIPSLGKVYLVPQLSNGLISIPTLDKIGCKSIFDDGRVYIFDKNGSMLLTGTLSNKLYYLDNKYIELLCNTGSEYHGSSSVVLSALETCCIAEECTLCNINNIENVEITCHISDINNNDNNSRHDVQGSAPKRLASSIVNMRPIELLHNRWGHLGENNIKKAIRLNMVTGAKYTYDEIKNDKLPICFNCMRGRMKTFVDSTGNVRNYKPFEKIAIDYKGKFPMKSRNGCNGFYLISDASTDFVYAYPCNGKSAPIMLQILDKFRIEIAELNGYTITKLQSDFDSVILSDTINEWLIKHHIKLQVSAPYSHAQNGQIERDMQNVLDKARTLLAVYETPKIYWDYAVETACYLINRSPTSNSDNTPYELVYNEKPDISNLVPFYAPGVYHLTREERNNSFDDKAVLCRMLGYNELCKNTYIILNIKSGAIVSRKDCIFDERLIHNVTMENIYNELENNFDDNDSITNSDNEDNTYDSDTEINYEDTANNNNNNDMYWYDNDNNTYNNTNDVDNYYSCVANTVHEAVKLPQNPSSVEQALASPEADKWREAMIKELQNFDDRSVFSAAEQEGRAMKTKWILKYAYYADYSIKYKARLVACGYSQIYGIDYKDTYAPTTSTLLVNLLFHLGAMFKLEFALFDVTAAFLEGKNDVVQYARLPFNNDGTTAAKGQGMRVRVVGNFYGEKQGPKIWNEQLDKILITIGFIRCNAHTCSYKWLNDDGFIILTIHVDDGLMISSNGNLYTEFKTKFSTMVKKMTLTLEFKKFLGMDVLLIEGNKVALSHLFYITARFSEFLKSERSPMSSTIN
jgi:hypothetical protein